MPEQANERAGQKKEKNKKVKEWCNALNNLWSAKQSTSQERGIISLFSLSDVGGRRCRKITAETEQNVLYIIYSVKIFYFIKFQYSEPHKMMLFRPESLRCENSTSSVVKLFQLLFASIIFAMTKKKKKIN